MEETEGPSAATAGDGEKDTAVTSGKTDKAPFSWLQPHPIFVIFLVGPEQQPFGMQKDFLCDRSAFYRQYFDEKGADESIEHVLLLPEYSKNVFGLFQNYLYTGTLITNKADVPSYGSLVSLWSLAHRFQVDGLCDKVVRTMVECRKLTGRIPATPLLAQVWTETPEGCGIRQLLLSWTAEYMRFSDSRADFAKSLPQEVLSELVVTMSAFEATPPVRPSAEPSSASASGQHRKKVHYLDDLSDEEMLRRLRKSRRTSAASSSNVDGAVQEQASSHRPHRTAAPKPQKRRPSAADLEVMTFSTSQKLAFCADLLNRMLSGPGFWTRLIGPFKDPVEPAVDGVPDYFDKVKHPMDLSTMKAKMDRQEYAREEDFLADMNLIFDNCFTYWNRGDPMWAAGEKFRRTFQEKYAHMNKWIVKMDSEGAVE